MNYLHLLATMADIQKEMQEIQSEDGFVSINPREIQVTPYMFKALFPNEDSIFDEVTGGYHYSAEICGIKVTAYEVSR